MTRTDEQQAKCEVMPSGWRGRWIRLRRFSLENWLYHRLSDHSLGCGNDFVPLDHRTLYVDHNGQFLRYEGVYSDTHGIVNVFTFLDDSFKIGIGWPSKWHCILRREVIHTFIWWYLRQWAFGEWFGVRRWLWYKLLHRRVARSRMHAKLSY
jgi:hypothetical protein